MTSATGPEGRDKFCGARKRQGEGTCTRPAGWGTEHPGIGRCKLHGGKTPAQNQQAARVQAERDVVLFAARRDVHPAEALLELVQWKAGEVDYWRGRVREIVATAGDDGDVDLTWGVVREKTGGEDHGTTYEARPNVAYVMLQAAERDLASYCAAALRAGVDERRVRLAESTGLMLAGVIQRILARLELTESQSELVATVVPAELRAIAADGQVAS